TLQVTGRRGDLGGGVVGGVHEDLVDAVGGAQREVRHGGAIAHHPRLEGEVREVRCGDLLDGQRGGRATEGDVDVVPGGDAELVGDVVVEDDVVAAGGQVGRLEPEVLRERCLLVEIDAHQGDGGALRPGRVGLVRGGCQAGGGLHP